VPGKQTDAIFISAIRSLIKKISNNPNIEESTPSHCHPSSTESTPVTTPPHVISNKHHHPMLLKNYC